MRGLRVRSCLIGSCGWLVVPAAAAQAQTAPTATFEVSALVVPGCRIDGAGVSGAIGSINFGNYAAVSRAVVTARLNTAAVTLRCTPGTALAMSVDRGQHGDGGRGLARSGGGVRLAYELFTDAAFASPIGIDQPYSLKTADTGVVALPIFGRLRLPGTAPAGLYADTVLVTLNW